MWLFAKYICIGLSVLSACVLFVWAFVTFIREVMIWRLRNVKKRGLILSKQTTAKKQQEIIDKIHKTSASDKRKALTKWVVKDNI